MAMMYRVKAESRTREATSPNFLVAVKSNNKERINSVKGIVQARTFPNSPIRGEVISTTRKRVKSINLLVAV